MRMPLLKEKIYYEPQDGWGTTEFYTLHRYLHRMLFYHEKMIVITVSHFS